MKKPYREILQVLALQDRLNPDEQARRLLHCWRKLILKIDKKGLSKGKKERQKVRSPREQCNSLQYKYTTSNKRNGEYGNGKAFPISLIRIRARKGQGAGDRT